MIDAYGRSAHFSGHNIRSIHSGASGRDARSRRQPISRWQSAFAPLQAGAEAGGESKQVTSARLLVVHEHAFPYVDLRVDDHAQPIAEITRLWRLYAPVADNYLKRVLEPDSPEANALSVGYLTAEEAGAVLAKERA